MGSSHIISSCNRIVEDVSRRDSDEGFTQGTKAATTLQLFPDRKKSPALSMPGRTCAEIIGVWLLILNTSEYN